MANEFKKGDIVRFVDHDGLRDEYPEFYPETGTTGTVICSIRELFHNAPFTNGRSELYIKWPEGSTSLDDQWACCPDCLELVKEGDEA